MLGRSKQEQHGGIVGFEQTLGGVSAAGSSSLQPAAPTEPLTSNIDSDTATTQYQERTTDDAAPGATSTSTLARGFRRRSRVNAARALNVSPSTGNGRRRKPRCQQCGESFATTTTLRRHEDTVHNRVTCDKFPCPYVHCRKHADPFLRADSLIRHQKKTLHYSNSPEPWSVYNQQHEPQEDIANGEVEDLEKLMKSKDAPPPQGRAELLNALARCRATRLTAQTQSTRLLADLQGWIRVDEDAAKRMTELEYLLQSASYRVL